MKGFSHGLDIVINRTEALRQTVAIDFLGQG
jgi:hypothetical protein